MSVVVVVVVVVDVDVDADVDADADVDVVVVVVVNVEIRCLFWLRLSTKKGVAAARALELPRTQPARVVRKTHRLPEKRFF